MKERIRFIEMYVVSYLTNCKLNGSNTQSDKSLIEDALYEASQAWDALIDYRNEASRSDVLIFEVFNTEVW